MIACLSIPVQARNLSPEWPSLSALNIALKREPLDPKLNYLAGLAYESSSVAGTERREVAKAGYAMALKGDPGFWPAHVQLGLISLEERDAWKAQLHFLEAAAINRNEPVIFYGLARSAYCQGQLSLALAAYKWAAALRAPSSPDEIATGAAILGRAGDREVAQQLAARIRGEADLLSPMVTSALATPEVGSMSPKEEQPRAEAPPQPPASTRMGMVDIIMLRRDETTHSSHGINLLDALTLQFGSSLINSTWSRSKDRLSNLETSSTQDITRDISASIPAVTYSLSIANARDGWSSVQAQQALLIYDGETSKITVGSSLTYATDGQMSSTVQTKDDGLSLQITPQFLPDGAVKLGVAATLEEFVDGAPAGSFRQSVQTERSTTNVTADIRFGETILVATGENQMSSRGGNTTPVLGSVPLLGSLFNRKVRSKANVSVIILMTLRPRGSEQLPHADEYEREHFEKLKDKLLDDIDGKADSRIRRFIPDSRAMQYKLENPARRRDAAYLERAGIVPFGMSHNPI